MKNARLTPVHQIAAVRIVFVMMAVTALICVSGCQGQPQGPPGGMPVPTVVATQPLKKKIVIWDEYTGRLEAVNYVEVRARVSGYLESMNFDEGEFVNEGDLLFVIDPKPFQAEVEQALASVVQAKAQKKQAESNLSVSKAQRNAAKARFDLAKNDLDRAQTLKDRNVITAEEFENRSAGLLEATANLEQADAQIEASEAALVTADADIAVSEASLSIARLNLSYTNITAPVKGRISQRNVTIGNLIGGGTSESTMLTTLVSLDPIYCVFYADESDFLKYSRLSQEGVRKSSRDYRKPVYVALADETEYVHIGHMDFVDNRLDSSTATILGRAILPNTDGFLTPGMFVRLRLPGSDPRETILLPDEAINTDQDSKFVYVINDQKKVDRVPVTLGPVSHGLRVIEKGLTGSENVVIQGVQKIRPGAEVKVDQKKTEELIKPTNNQNLPDEYEDVPREKWLIAPPETKPAEATGQPNKSAVVDPI